jgi:hypothetical protein
MEPIQPLSYILKAFPEDNIIIKKYMLLILLFRDWKEINNSLIYVIQKIPVELAHSVRLFYLKLYPTLKKQLKPHMVK